MDVSCFKNPSDGPQTYFILQNFLLIIQKQIFSGYYITQTSWYIVRKDQIFWVEHEDGD